jgi:pyridoxine/pyridoxamine 5'-phosphate oxidase
MHLHRGMATPPNYLLNNARAHEVMLRTRPDQRTSPRAAVCVSATAAFLGSPALELVALLRDVSSNGAMFYTNFPESAVPPEVGAEVTLRFQMPVSERRLKVVWTGKVVRLIRYAAGAATGVAMKLDRQEFAEISH